MSSGSKEREESEKPSIVDAYSSTESAKPMPAPNYFGQMPAPQRGGEEEDAHAHAPAHAPAAVSITFPYTNRGNAWRLNEIHMVPLCV